MYRVSIELWKHEWKFGRTRNAVQLVFPQLFPGLPNFHECFYKSIETRSTCFLFLLENTATGKRKTTCLLSLLKCKFSLLAPSLRQQCMLVLCLHRVIQTRFLTYQRTCCPTCRTVFLMCMLLHVIHTCTCSLLFAIFKSSGFRHLYCSF